MAPVLPLGSGVLALGVFHSRSTFKVRAVAPRADDIRRPTLYTVIGIPFLLLVACVAVGQMSAITEEYRTKATFLTAFPSFVDWRDEAFTGSAAPFVICVVGDFRFGTSLAEFTRSSASHKRRVEVRWMHKDDELRKCHILFVSSSESKRYAKVLQSVQGRRRAHGR